MQPLPFYARTARTPLRSALILSWEISHEQTNEPQHKASYQLVALSATQGCPLHTHTTAQGIASRTGTFIHVFTFVYILNATLDPVWELAGGSG